MKLLSVSVSHYRSITQARKLGLGDFTVLIGPNNEGKSNILRALVLALSTLRGHRRRRYAGRYRRDPDLRYDWQRDFPVHLQEKKPKGESKFVLEFELTDAEIEDFRRDVKSKLNESLPIELSFGPQGPQDVSFKVRKRGPGAQALSKKVIPITAFLAKCLDFEYIPAIRTAEAAEEVVERMVAKELAPVEDHPKFVQALNAIEDLQRPILHAVSDSIRDTLKVFLPAVQNVTVDIAQEDRFRALRRSCRITVDDGTATLLQLKGDGVQSLAALSLMRYSSLSGARGKNIIIAIEEPESHLHPEAIHALRGVLREISSKHQLIITTHCPLFVDRDRVHNNVIVLNKKAKSAKNVADVRDALGVRASDNLRHAELVLLVEGPEDQRALRALIAAHSQRLGRVLEDRTLAIEVIGGAGNLSYRASEISAALCSAHCFLDYDKSSQDAANRAKLDGVLTDGDINFCMVDGLNESEFEDLLDSAAYQERLRNQWRV
jgi:energy-coupling factor transporter ATP-binding protein EcfA2